MQKAINFISEQLNLPIEFTEDKVKEYIEHTGKETVTVDDVPIIIEEIIRNMHSTEEDEMPHVQRNSDLTNIEDESDIIDQFETPEEKSKNDNMLFLAIAGFVTILFLVIIFSKIFKVHTIYMFGSIMSVAVGYMLIEFITGIRKRGK